jgi:hypothetical protein
MHFFITLSMIAFAMFAMALGVTHSLKPNLGCAIIVSPQVLSASTTMTTNGVDTRDFESAMVLVTTGAIAGAGNFSVKLVESDTNSSDYTDVAAADYDCDIAPAGVLAADTTYRLGYKGSKRYIGVVFTKNSGTSIAAHAVAVRGRPHQRPV